VKSVIVGTLIGEDASNGSTFDVNEKLFTEGFADKVQENYACQVWFTKSICFSM